MSCKELIIKGERFVYEDESETITYDNIQPITIEDAKHLLHRTKQLFDKIGLPMFLAYGTLLGAVREKSLISGDEDVDVYVTDEQKLYDNIPWLNDNGLRLCRRYKGALYSFKINKDAYIDVYILRKYKNALWAVNCFSLCGLATPKRYFRKSGTIELFGDLYHCPYPPEEILEFWYGKDWRIPQKGHNYICEIKVAYYWKNLIRPIFSKIIKTIIFYRYWKKYRYDSAIEKSSDKE